jgi:asparagine synthase (glutamine-hydrolysing)
MSAIFGIVYLEGRSVHPVELQDMAASLHHRGSAQTWSMGSVGMGHCSFAAQPVPSPGAFSVEDADLWVVADVRLDNRSDLLSRLGLAGMHTEISDAGLIVEAYRRWGDQCADRLLGDFAFALWDEQRRQLLCARDHVGVKPFYYVHCPGSFFAWATEIKALFCLSPSLRQIDEVRLAERLALIDWDLTDQSTLYRQVVSLPPAHTVKVKSADLVIRRYWALDPERSLERGSAGDHAESFGDLFTEAVRCRLHGPDNVGALLSGGLDSSAIAWMAQGQAGGSLPTFSAVFDTVTVCGERTYIEPILAQGRFIPHWSLGDQASPLAELERMLCRQDELIYAPGMALMSMLYRAAQHQGINVLLDGHGGDEVTGCGAVYYRELARTGQWITLTQEIYASARRYQEPFWPLFWPYLQYGARWRGRAAALLRRVGTFNQAPGQRKDHPSLWERWLHPEFVERVRLRERYQAFQQRRPERARSERESHYRLLTGRAQVRALEILNKASAANGVELRFPFWDKRLVEFCLALPSAHKVYRGWDRITLRRAMQNRLPAQVQWRKDKTDFAPNLVHLLRSQDRARLDHLLLGSQSGVDDYLNRAAVEAAYRQFLDQDQPASSVLQIVLQAASFILWLQGAQHLPQMDS